MITLTTFEMQLINNEPDGIRICRVRSESIVTIVIPRSKLSEAKQLPDIPDRGIYYLLDEDHGTLSRVYAGQTTQGIGRLDAHKAKKEFWNKAVMFLDSNQNIGKDVLDGLEAKAIDYVMHHGSYETDNTVVPKPFIDPYEEETIERMHASILFRMTVLGYDLGRVDPGPVATDLLFHTKKNGIRGVGRYDKDTGHFTVLAGSQINLAFRVIKNVVAEQVRNDIFDSQEGVAVLDRDLEFTSPSAAAVFVLGGSQNGWTEWVNDAGQTLDRVYRAKKND